MCKISTPPEIRKGVTGLYVNELYLIELNVLSYTYPVCSILDFIQFLFSIICYSNNKIIVKYFKKK